MLLLTLIFFGLTGVFLSCFDKYRDIIILLLSTLAIAAFSLPSLLFSLIFSSINYRLIKNIHQKKWMFITCICFNLLGLALFHYYEFFHQEWGIVPIIFGISYLTLQFIDYATKIYFKVVSTPKNFIQYTSAVLFVPKFFMGPIVSLPDLEKEINIKTENKPKVYYGLNRILLGLIKKLVLAESLAIYVSSALDFKDNYPGLTILSGACLYALQLYFDFSGYCDIAIGASALWNINLPENFNFPFQQKTWVTFWKSWHSSLTQWLWQYIFMPLYVYFGRKKLNKLLTQGICVVLVFSVMAFFNGVKSGFFISALLYAVFYLIELFFNRKDGTISNLFIFLLFSVGLLFFRTPDYNSYSFLTERLIDIKTFLPTEWLSSYFAPLASGGALQDYFNFSLTIILCILFLFFERRIVSTLSQNKINSLIWFTMLLLLITWGVFTSGSRFIYMQF